MVCNLESPWLKKKNQRFEGASHHNITSGFGKNKKYFTLVSQKLSVIYQLIGRFVKQRQRWRNFLSTTQEADSATMLIVVIFLKRKKGKV